VITTARQGGLVAELALLATVDAQAARRRFRSSASRWAPRVPAVLLVSLILLARYLLDGSHAYGHALLFAGAVLFRLSG
jgi:hypothetical protein